MEVPGWCKLCAGLGSRGGGTCGGCLVPVLYRHDGGFAEEAVLVVHQVLVDAGFAGLVATRLEHSRDGVGIADWAEVLFTGGLWTESEEWLGLYLYLPRCVQMY